METTSPIDSDVAFFAVQSCCAFHAATCTDAAKLEETIEDWAIVSDIVFGLFFRIPLHVIRRDLLEELDIFVCMELCHFVLGCRFCALDHSY